MSNFIYHFSNKERNKNTYIILRSKINAGKFSIFFHSLSKEIQSQVQFVKELLLDL